MLQLQDYLQNVQAHQKSSFAMSRQIGQGYNLQNYFWLHNNFYRNFLIKRLIILLIFETSVPKLWRLLLQASDKTYLSSKLLKRFAVSPLAIPETHLALCILQSSKVITSCFKNLYDLKDL